MKERILINVEWEGPHSLGKVATLNRRTDKGLYQVYGGHPANGAGTLLYIGLAVDQTFGERIPQGGRWTTQRVEIYVGRLYGKTPDEKTWKRRIEWAERLLIYAHKPPENSQKNLGEMEKALCSVRVLNWSEHRDLLPEVSGARWVWPDERFRNYNLYGEQAKAA